MKYFFVIIILFFSPGLCQHIAAQNMDQRIKTFLLKKFPEKQTLREGELQYAEKTALLKKDLSAFGNWFPGMEFYTTKLQTAYFEFPEVEILVAVEPGAMSGIKILKSLSFEPPDASFLKLFYGCHVQTGKEQQQLAHAITKLLASVAVQPEIEMLSAANSPDVLYRISQANHGYIDFTYKFSQHKKLVEILIHGN